MIQREPETALHETWARDFDLVIAEQYPGHAAPRYPELDRVRLTSDAIRLAVPPEAEGRARVTSLADTAEMPWVMEPRGAASRHWAEQACRSAGFEPDVRFETADLQAQIRLIESGNAVALMPDLVWTGRGTTAQLTELPGKAPPDGLHLRAPLQRPAACHPRRPRGPGGHRRLHRGRPGRIGCATGLAGQVFRLTAHR